MRGELIGVWSETGREIWQPLIEQADVAVDIFCELYRDLAPHLKVVPKTEQLAEAIEDPACARRHFESTRAEDIAGERALVTYFEQTHGNLDEFGGDILSNAYFNLLRRFIEKFNLRYELRRPCQLSPTVPGLFTSLFRDLRSLANRDAHLSALMTDFESAIRDLRTDCSEGRIKTCIQKQMNLLEALGGMVPGVTANELGGICNQITTWPHGGVKSALRGLYGFASDYPGIRHAGNPKGALRAIEMRDMVAMSILLVGFTPYLSDGLDADTVFRGN